MTVKMDGMRDKRLVSLLNDPKSPLLNKISSRIIQHWAPWLMILLTIFEFLSSIKFRLVG